MEQKGELISYRPDIKVVDCTIRDGGLVNNFYFDDEFVRNLYTANVAAGVESVSYTHLDVYKRQTNGYAVKA